MTNGDKIRAMSNREFAEFFCRESVDLSICDCCQHYPDNCSIHNCIDGVEAWLNSEAEDNGND